MAEESLRWRAPFHAVWRTRRRTHPAASSAALSHATCAADIATDRRRVAVANAGAVGGDHDWFHARYVACVLSHCPGSSAVCASIPGRRSRHALHRAIGGQPRKPRRVEGTCVREHPSGQRVTIKCTGLSRPGTHAKATFRVARTFLPSPVAWDAVVWRLRPSISWAGRCSVSRGSWDETTDVKNPGSRVTIFSSWSLQNVVDEERVPSRRQVRPFHG